jgi:signal transduction histidine kinase/CheY-like chemotaxis protein
LEQRVTARTAELSAALEQLRSEVRERQRIEDALHQAQKMEAIGQLTGGIAHDFNNMLQAIAGNLELIPLVLEQGLPAEALRFVDAANRTVERATTLIDRLLAFGRRQSLEPVTVAPGALVQDLVELIRRAVGPQIELVLRLGHDIWTVLCDPNQLENVLLNLAINARDAMPDGGRLTISLANVSLSEAELAGQEGAKAGEYVQIAVTDTGVGMTSEVQARAFEPFFTTKGSGQGTGLGLAQMHGFVRQSNGAVKLESRPGKGTTVRLYLPRQMASAVPVPQRPAAAPVPAIKESSAGTVLIVEDELSIRTLVAVAIRRLGCRVLEASDGLAGLRLLQSREPIDLLVTDVGLPGLDGRQLADAGREWRPDLPVLLITGYIGSPDMDWELPPGVEAIGKPFKLNTLMSRISKLLEHRAKAMAG